jgi:hypothetical protein
MKAVRAVHRGKGFAKSLPPRRGTANDLEREAVCCTGKNEDGTICCLEGRRKTTCSPHLTRRAVVSAPREVMRRLSSRGRRGKKPARTDETAGRKHRNSVCVRLGNPNRALSVGATLRGRSRKPVGVLRCMGLERAFAAERPSPSERNSERLLRETRLSHKKKRR